jgi:FkbM family methyltransferase
MILNRYDYHVGGGGNAFGVGFQLLQSSSFDQSEVDSVLHLLGTRRANYGDGIVAIDCGANIGVHTVEWAQFMQGWGTVIAFEAQERVYYALAGNIAINNCFNARAVWAAVGDRDGSIGVPTPNYFEASSFGSLELRKSQNNEYIGQAIDYRSEQLQETRLVAIDNMDLVRLDFLKVDIEGMEMEALVGARETIRTHKPQLLIEKIKSDESQIRTFLLGLGYHVMPLGINMLAIHESDPAKNSIQIKS